MRGLAAEVPLDAAQLGRTDDLARLAACFRVNSLNGGDQVRPEPDRVVIPLVKGKPRCGLITLGKPACHHGGFPESRWSRDQGQLARQTFVQALIKTWAWDEADAEWGHIELGGKKLIQF